jgi:hypothetical protein
MIAIIILIGAFLVGEILAQPYKSLTSALRTRDDIRKGYTAQKDTLTGEATSLDTLYTSLMTPDGHIAQYFALEWDVTDVTNGEDICYYLEYSYDNSVWLADATLDTLGAATTLLDELDFFTNSSLYKYARIRAQMIANGADADKIAYTVDRYIFFTDPKNY